jgi:hypothetical protein
VKGSVKGSQLLTWPQDSNPMKECYLKRTQQKTFYSFHFYKKKFILQSLYFTYILHVYPSFANVIFHFPFIILINYNGNGDGDDERGSWRGLGKGTSNIVYSFNRK